MTLVKLIIDPTAGESGRMITETYQVVRETKRSLVIRGVEFDPEKERFGYVEWYIAKKKLQHVQPSKGGKFAKCCYWLIEDGEVKDIKTSYQMETAVLRIVDVIRGELQNVANILLRMEEGWG